jgi:hypothetical protein
METSIYIADLSESELGCRSQLSAGGDGTFLDHPAIDGPTDSDIETTIAAIRISNDNLLYEDIFLAD